MWGVRRLAAALVVRALSGTVGDEVRSCSRCARLLMDSELSPANSMTCGFEDVCAECVPRYRFVTSHNVRRRAARWRREQIRHDRLHAEHGLRCLFGEGILR